MNPLANMLRSIANAVDNGGEISPTGELQVEVNQDNAGEPQETQPETAQAQEQPEEKVDSQSSGQENISAEREGNNQQQNIQADPLQQNIRRATTPSTATSTATWLDANQLSKKNDKWMAENAEKLVQEAFKKYT